MKKVVVLLISFVLLFSSCGLRDKSDQNQHDNSKNEVVNNIEPEKENTESEKTSSQNTTSLPDNLGLPGGLQLPLNRNLIINPEIDDKDSVKWSSSNPNAVSVENNGKIIPLAVGESVITASIDDAEGKFRVIVSESPNTFVYKKDPGSLNEEGKGEDPDSGEKFPFMVPDGITEINNSELDAAGILWEFLINDTLITEVTVPNLGVSYLIRSHVELNAKKQDSGFSPYGEYKGTLVVEGEIDEESFLAAMNSIGARIDNMQESFVAQKMDVSFTMETYNSDAIDKAKYAYAPEGTVPVAPLLEVIGMVISEGKTLVSGDIEITSDEGGVGHGSISNEPGSIPFVIEIYSDGKATLFLPRMLAGSTRNWFNGDFIKLPILWLK